MSEKAMFGAGCFWGVEAAFNKLDGVLSTSCGYSGGHTVNPTYEDICSHTTGHAEVVLIEFDPEKLSYEKLLEKLWQIHDPTTVNRQGPDIGDQYRSAIYFFTEEQKRTAETSKKYAQSQFNRPIVTEITPAPTFYKAEEYHQKYFEKHGGMSCHTK